MLVVCEDTSTIAHPGFESDELQNHFHSEDSSEDHIENVHDIVKERRLAVVLRRQRESEQDFRESEAKGQENQSIALKR